MTDGVIPVIQREDYPAFQKLMVGLPSTHDVWNARQVEELREAMRQGERPTEVVVFPDAFAEYLRVQRLEGSVTTLEAFAVVKADFAR